MKYFITHLFFTIGLLFVGTIIHELTHHFMCGGNFIAGFFLENGKIGVGVTYCINDNNSEFLPYLFTALFILPIYTYKLFKDIKG